MSMWNEQANEKVPGANEKVHSAIYRRTGGRKKTGPPGPMSRPKEPRMRGFRCALLQRYVRQGAAARAQAP